MSGFGHLGTGREKTGDGLNNSYPYVAVHSLSDVAAKTGMVFSHPISASLVNDARPINEAVGARREDKRVLVQHGTSGGADPRHPGRWVRVHTSYHRHRWTANRRIATSRREPASARRCPSHGQVGVGPPGSRPRHHGGRSRLRAHANSARRTGVRARRAERAPGAERGRQPYG